MKEAVSSLWCDVFDVFGGHNNGGKVEEMFTTWLNLETSLPRHGELCWLANENVEGVIILINGAKGHFVGMEVKCKSKPIALANFRSGKNLILLITL